jgi:hypothetical protein
MIITPPGVLKVFHVSKRGKKGTESDFFFLKKRRRNVLLFEKIKIVFERKR